LDSYLTQKDAKNAKTRKDFQANSRGAVVTKKIARLPGKKNILFIGQSNGQNRKTVKIMGG